MLSKRRNRRQAPSYQTGNANQHGSAGGEKRPNVTPTPTLGTAFRNVDNFDPMPDEDGAIIKEVSRIRDNIKNHVRSYYHFDPIPAPDIDSPQFDSIAAATNIPPSTIRDILSNPYSRNEAIRLVVAWAVLSRCRDNGRKGESLLPREISDLSTAMLNTQGQSSSEYIHKIRRETSF
jgi:hypothetical protein